jgi:hypothetical protein
MPTMRVEILLCPNTDYTIQFCSFCAETHGKRIFMKETHALCLF